MWCRPPVAGARRNGSGGWTARFSSRRPASGQRQIESSDGQAWRLGYAEGTKSPVGTDQLHPQLGGGGGPARVVARQRVDVRGRRSVSLPGRRHDQRRTQDGVQIVELVAYIGARPVQSAGKHIADLVEREIEHVGVEFTRDVGRAQRARLFQFALALGVKPLDQHRCGDADSGHRSRRGCHGPGRPPQSSRRRRTAALIGLSPPRPARSRDARVRVEPHWPAAHCGWSSVVSLPGRASREGPRAGTP